MIVVKRISDVNYAEHDEVWAIVRSLKHQNRMITQVSELSPSSELFQTYLSLKDEGKWNKDAFQKIYVPQFLHEMHSKEAKMYLRELCNLDAEGKNICIVCFCPDEELCHRSIVAGLLQGAGCNVSISKDYSFYFDQWKTMM